jgi:hypothetical protein
VLTNALGYDNDLTKFPDSGTLNITTSIDVGFKENFATVRGNKGKSGPHKVLFNLKSYAKNNSQNAIIEHIFTEGNTSLSEPTEFSVNIERYKLLGCPFQLSYDFERECFSRRFSFLHLEI